MLHVACLGGVVVDGDAGKSKLRRCSRTSKVDVVPWSRPLTNATTPAQLSLSFVIQCGHLAFSAQ